MHITLRGEEKNSKLVVTYDADNQEGRKTKGRREEMQRVKAVLRGDNYATSFIQKCERALPRPTFPRSLTLYFGPERWERSHGTSRSPKRTSREHELHGQVRKLRATLL